MSKTAVAQLGALTSHFIAVLSTGHLHYPKHDNTAVGRPCKFVGDWCLSFLYR